MSFGGAVKLTGESEYRKALQQITQNLKEVSAQMKLTTATYDKNDTSMAALAAKSSDLTSKLGLQTDKLNTLKKQYAAMSQQYTDNANKHNLLIQKYEDEKAKLDYIGKTLGTTSKEYQDQKKVVEDLAIQVKNSIATQDNNAKSMSNMGIQIKRAEADVITTKKAISDLDNEMAKSSEEAKRNSSAYGTLKTTISQQESALKSLKTGYANVVLEQGENSQAAKDLAKQMNTLDSELAENKSKLREAEKAADGLSQSLDDTGKSAEKSSGGFTVLKGAIANLISNGISKLASAITGQLDSAISRVDTINSYKKTMENLGYATDDVSKTTDTLKKGIEGLPTTLPNIMSMQQQYAALSGDIDEATNLTLALNNATLAGGQGQEVANSAMEQWYQIIAKGKPDATAWQIINSAMPSQMNQIAQEVMGAGKKSQDLFTAWQKGTVTTKQIKDALINLNSEGGSGLASFEKQAQDSTGGIDTSMTNLKTAISNGIANIIESIGSENIANALSGLKSVASEAFKAVGEAIDFVIEHKDEFVTALIAMSAGVAAYVGYTTAIQVMTQGWKSLEIVQKAVTAAQWLMNTAMNANPIGLVIAGIVALVAAFVVLWNKSESFRNFWIGLWEKIKEVAEPIISALSEWFSIAWEKIKEIWQPVSEFFSSLFTSIGESVFPIIESISNAFTEAWELIKVVWDLVQPYFATVWENIKIIFSVVKDVLGNFFSAAWDVIKVVWDVAVIYFKTIWENIKTIFSVVKDVLGAYFQLAWTAIKAVWDTVTSYFKAIWDTIAGIFSVVKNVLTGNWRDAWEGIKGIVNTWVNFFSGVWNNIKNVFSGVITFFKTTFSSAWNAVKGVFSNWASFFGNLWNIIKDKFSSIGTSIANAISKSVKSGINGVISIIEKTINGAISLINGAINLINKIPGVSIGNIRKLSLPKLAKGGVLDDGARTVIAGEDGAEAIVPLEKNTKWIKLVADRLQNSMLGGSNSSEALNTNLAYRGIDSEYNLLVKSFKAALSEMTVEMDDTTMGRFVEKTVARAIYS